MNLDVILQQLLNGVILGSIYGLIAIGYTMVYGILRMINFAHADVYMVGCYITAISIALLRAAGVENPIILIGAAIAATMVVAGIYGFTIERVAYRPIRSFRPGLPILISALGMSLVLQNYVQVSQGARNQAVPTLVPGIVRIGGETDFVQITIIQIILVTVAIFAMAALTLIMRKTSLGRQTRATQQDRWMAEVLGIKTNRIISLVFVIGALMAAIASVFVTLNYGSFDFYVGFITGIKAFTAAVLGGIGSLPGAMLGGIVLGLLEALFSGFVNADYKDVFSFVVLIVLLMVRPSGLLGRPEVEKV